MDSRRIDGDLRSVLDSGDHNAAATLALERYGPAVRRYLRLSMRDERDAADAFSLFEENVWRGLAAFRAESSLRTWIFSVARHAATDVQKQAWRHREQRLTNGIANKVAEDVLETAGELRGVLTPLLPYLSESERTLLLLRVEHELRWAEIAHILSTAGRKLDTSTVIKRFERLTARLRRMARQHGILP